MKIFKITFISLLATAALFLYFNKNAQGYIKDYVFISPCDTPIPFRIGSVDSHFGVSTDTFKTDVAKAARIWSNVYGKNLFEYDPEAALSVNLVYDGRQSLTNKVNQLEGELNSNQTNLKTQIENYQTQSQNFRKAVEDLNNKIDYWNSQGGAPQDVYQSLVNEQNQLKNEAAQLNQIAQKLNLSTGEYNNQVNQLNQTINTFNQALSKKPEEGLYDPQKNTIDIYFDTSQNEFIHTLSHELGHALGMNHVQDPQAIMNPYTNSYITPTQDDIHELERACQKQNRFIMMTQNLLLLLHKELVSLGISQN